MVDEARIPKIVGDASTVQALRLTATEGFVLSRIDGVATEKELAALTGLPESTVRGSLEKLASLKVLVFLSRPPPPPPPPKAATKPASGPSPASGEGSPSEKSAQSGEKGAAAEGTAIPQRIKAAMAAIAPDAAELLEDVDLDLDFKLRVLATVTVIDSLDYYEILGVDRGADKKAIKRAYFEIAALFHPDRYFRKRIGSYKLRMETLFGRATQALDTLTNKQLRAEYDAYLGDLDRTRAIEDLMRSAAAEAERAEQDALQSAGRATLPEINVEPGKAPPPAFHDTSPPDSTRPRISGLYSAPKTPPPAAASTSVVPSSGGPPVSDQSRRDALAARLLGSRTLSSRGMPAVSRPSNAGMPRVVAGPVSSTAPGRVGDEGDALKRRYADRVALARKAQAAKYLALAHEAQVRKDVVGAATAFRVALGFLDADDPNRELAKTAIAQADEILAETYLRQALYEDRSEHWQDAARSWQRVVRGRPKDARAHERAAHALAKSHGDLHVAAQYAQRAVALEPENPEYKVTLGLVFVEAGLLLNARRELEAALQLSPRNANIQALLKRANKAG